MQRITDKNKIQELYKSGQIHKSTYYRALKRGYLVLDYHKPHTQGNTKWWSEEDLELIYNKLPKIAAKTAYVWAKVIDKFLISDLVQDTILYLYERGEDVKNLDHFLSVAKSHMRSLLRDSKRYREYGISDRVSRQVGGEWDVEGSLEHMEKVL